jgi:hypothetical protein
MNQELHDVLNGLAPELEPDLKHYIMSYFQDQTSDFSAEALKDFLLPLLDGAEISDEACQNISSLLMSNASSSTVESWKPVQLTERVVMSGLMSNTQGSGSQGRK